MKLGCQNLMYNLPNRNLHNTYNLSSKEHGEHSEQHLIQNFKQLRDGGRGKRGGGSREGRGGVTEGGRVVLIFAIVDNVMFP